MTYAKQWRVFVAGAVLATFSAAASAGDPAPPGTLDVTLAPATPDAQKNIPAVDVRIVIGGITTGLGQPFLEIPLARDNVQGVADTLVGLEVNDAIGPLHLAVHDDPAGGSTLYRHWTSDRAVTGSVTVAYRVPIDNLPNPRGAAPPLELRTEQAALSGSGGIFLILPESTVPFRIHVAWDLSHVGGVGLSTVGPGDVALSQPQPASFLASTYFMGGDIAHYPAALPKDGFAAAWQGDAPFDAHALMQWTNGLYGYYLKFFRAPAQTAYTVFLRRNPINAGGGVEIGHSFVGTFDANTKPENLKITLAHEMVHTFVGTLGGSDSGLDESWYSEGLAVYYERLLPLRAGQITPAQYLADLNQTAGRYYTDLLNNTPNDQIAARFWADTRIRVLPYDRGSLYFADLNDRIRTATRGQKSLDDLVLAMMDHRAQGLPADEDAWVALLRQTLGDAGVAAFHAMLAGKLVVPQPDAFGPCFTRTTARLRRYDLGFDPDVLVQPRRVVRGLVAGSAAAQAGLRNGDEIVKPVPQDAIQADQHATLALLIRRGSIEFPVSYLPRGERVEAIQWKRLPRQKDETCRKW